MKSFNNTFPLLPSGNGDGYTWALMQGKCDGEQIIVRKNTSAKQWVSHPKMNIKISFAIPLNSPNPGALPNSEENMALKEIEDTIVGEVLKDFTGIFVMAITTGVFKEFVFYVVGGPDIQSLHKRIEKLVTTHAVQCVAEIDRQWLAYNLY